MEIYNEIIEKYGYSNEVFLDILAEVERIKTTSKLYRFHLYKILNKLEDELS